MVLMGGVGRGQGLTDGRWLDGLDGEGGFTCEREGRGSDVVEGGGFASLF